MPSISPVLTTDQRIDLEARVRSGRGRADAARRARVILLLAEGCSYAAIATMTGCSSRTIALWKQRFAKDGLAGLAARHGGSKPTVLTPALEARIMTWTRRPPSHGATHWSTRSLGRQMGVQHTIISRAWRHAGLQPHRLERYMRSTDPEAATNGSIITALTPRLPSPPAATASVARRPLLARRTSTGTAARRSGRRRQGSASPTRSS